MNWNGKVARKGSLFCFQRTKLFFLSHFADFCPLCPLGYAFMLLSIVPLQTENQERHIAMPITVLVQRGEDDWPAPNLAQLHYIFYYNEWNSDFYKQSLRGTEGDWKRRQGVALFSFGSWRSCSRRTVSKSDRTGCLDGSATMAICSSETPHQYKSGWRKVSSRRMSFSSKQITAP